MRPSQPGVRHHELRRLGIAPRQAGIHGHSVAGRSGTACSADSEGRQAQRGGDGLVAGPLESKRSAQASGMEARRGETPWVARCTARQRDPAPPGDARKSVKPAMRLYSKPQKHETTFTHLRIPTEPYICKSGFVSLHESGLTYLRQAVHPRTCQSVKQGKRKKARSIRRAAHLPGFVKRPAAGRGVRTTVSRPCCATRSGCACRPRLQPAGRRWSPGTMDHPGSPTGKADPPC
jgi:hypothetical protein